MATAKTSSKKVALTDARACAAQILLRVLEHGESLDQALRTHGIPDSERALIQELCYGVLRWHGRLDALARKRLTTPLKQGPVHCLLLLGLYQLIYLRVAPHAAVDLTVAACTALKQSWAKGLVNAVLRGFLRERADLLEAVDRDEQAALAHPVWLLERFKADWPDDWRTITRANNARPPLTLRVNALKVSRAAYLDQLNAAGIAATALPHTPCGLQLEKPLAVEDLPGFAEGMVSVQDGAAQQAVPLLDLRAGQRVLDACSAPGGKTCHILESQPTLQALLALDCHARRIKRIQQNLDRLQLHAMLVMGDATRPADWWDGVLFDRILLDAPCSATGVIRRHPDIKLLRSAADVAKLAAVQTGLLSALWPLLKSGGMLLYATCSVLQEENERPVQQFLARHDDARAAPFTFPWQDTALSATVGQQILPGTEGMDGFYYARLHKL
jgi:16S rRNA (cytosine967-C5)-methyltransferase